jgi:hypothetical protein
MEKNLHHNQKPEVYLPFWFNVQKKIKIASTPKKLWKENKIVIIYLYYIRMEMTELSYKLWRCHKYVQTCKYGVQILQ